MGMMQRSNIRVYFGKNERFGHAGALLAKVRFIHVDSIIRQFFLLQSVAMVEKVGKSRVG
jgi:hypothetical protein